MSKNIFEIDEKEFYNHMFKDFGKSKEDLEGYIKILGKWAETQHHFPEKPTYRTLRFFVLSNKFSIERAKQKLDMYYTMRGLMPELYGRHPLSPEMVLQNQYVYCIPLPKVTQDFHRIYYMQCNPKYGPEVFSHEKFAAQFVNLMELFIEADDCYKFHCIFDHNGSQVGHLPKLSPMVIKKTSTVQEKVFSNRLSSIHLVNFHPFLEHFLNAIAKPAMNPKLRNRIKVCSGTDILLDIFGKSRMPKDIGGEETSLDDLNDLLLKEFEKHKERFDKLLTLKVNESLRPSKLVNDDVLGYYGNFKKINVD